MSTPRAPSRTASASACLGLPRKSFCSEPSLTASHCAFRIEEKLLELGYTMDDVRGHAVQSHSVYNNESELTDRAWSMAKKKLVTAIEEERAKKREVEAAAAMRSRAEALKPFWTALQASIASGDERMLFPPWANFLHLPAVKQLYEPEDAKPSQEDLLRVRAAVMREAQAFGEEIQAAFYAKLVVAHTEAVTPVTPLDDLAALARLVTLAVPCPSRWCQTWATFPAILDHTKVCRAWALTQHSLSTSPRQVRAILHVLGAVNDVEPGKVDAATTSTSDLYALGEAFECETCKPKQTAVGPAVWSRAHSTTMGWGAAVRPFFSSLRLLAQADALARIGDPHPRRPRAADLSLIHI